MASPQEPRRRFAPVPIETTFESVRKPVQLGRSHAGPNPELTPEQSPRSPPPTPPRLHELQGRRRFAPQLIETSRRARRVGDNTPATKPTDKTDITPYTNHIYLSRPKAKRRRDGSVDDEPERPMPPTRRETEEEGVKEYLLELAARDAARQIEEAALAAFPNSRAREGGVAHFYFRESSESDGSPEGASPADDQTAARIRRKSSNLGLNWWHKHMQEHAEHAAHERGDDEMAVDDGDDEADRDSDNAIMRTDSDLDRMELPAPPDLMWITNKRVPTDDRRDSLAEMQGPKREAYGALGQPDIDMTQGPGKQDTSAAAAQSSLAFGGPVLPHTTASSARPGADQDGFARPFGRPFGAFGLPVEDHKLLRLRQAASPPMLGKDLTFRKCPSPKETKLETDHSFARRGLEEEDRDRSGAGGLWNGYCCRSAKADGYIVPANLHAPDMMVTPYPPGSPHSPCGPDCDAHSMSEEPSSMITSDTSEGSSPGTVDLRLKTRGAKGLHVLQGLDERLRLEKVDADLEDKISQEFDDEFVTQVYNYLSLGYPSMARGFDDELSKISLVSIEELRRADSGREAQGYLLEMNLEDTPEEQRCPRWKALRTYIVEWARQHQDLDSLDPLAWGVRARRGSWAI